MTTLLRPGESSTEQIHATLRSEDGILNIVTLAVALPVLLLIFAAALDVIRLPLGKQKLYGVLEGELSSLAVSPRSDPLSGFVSCFTESPSPSCKACERCTLAPNRAQAQRAVDNALANINGDLEGASDGARPSAAVSLFIIKVDEQGRAVAVEETAGASSGRPESRKKLSDALRSELLSHDSSFRGVLRGFSVNGRPLYSDTAVAAVSAELPIRYLFGFTKRLRLGAQGPGDSALVAVTLFRALPQQLSLSQHENWP